MTAAIGNDAVFVPILPSLDKFFTETQKGSKQAGERAGKSFSDALSKSVEQAERRVNTTSRAYERAQNRATDAADKTRLAETKLAEVMENGNATASQVQTATNNLNKARRDQVAAENNAESASKDLTRAQENLTKAQQEQDDATTESTDGMKDWSLSAEEAQKASEDLEAAQKTLEIGIAATATALVGAIGGLVNIGSSFHDMSRQIAVGSGATGDDLRALEESAMSVATTVPVSFEESADALATLNTLTGESGPALEDLTSQVLEASNLLGEDGTANAEKFGTALSLWEVDAATGAEALDGLFTITQDYGVSLSDLSGTLSTYGSVMKNVGFSMEESAVLFGSLEKAGISVSRIMPGMNKAFRDWADEGLNVREELTKVVDQVAETEDGTEALSIATEAFGAQGASRLTTAIRNGSFALEDFEDVLGDTEGAIANTAEENRTLEESFQLMKNEALVAIEPLATELFDRLVPAVELAGEKLVEAIEWIQENEDLVKTLAVGVGAAATALLGFRTAAMAVEAAMRVKNVMVLLSTQGWKGLNAVMRRNVIGLIVTAIAGLVAGLVYFFTQTEKGQEIWAIFTEHLGAAWDWVVEKLSAGWEWLKEHVFDPFMAFAQETLLPIWESALESITDAWEWLTEAMQSAWENILQPTFSAIADIAVWLWENVLQNVFKFILGYWEFMIGAMQLAWENVLRPTFEVLAQVATWLWETVLQPVFGFIGRAWDQLLTVMQWAWESILRPTFEVLGDVAVWLAENVLAPAFDFIGNAWDHLSTAIKWAWENLIKPTWEFLQSAAVFMWENVLQPVFDWIQDGWQRLADGIAWVYENIILGTWNALQDAATWMYENVLMPVFGFIQERWEILWGNVRRIYFEVIKPTWDALQDAATWMYENVLEPVFRWIGDRWTDMAEMLEFGWHWIRDNVFDPLGSGLETVQGWFEAAVDGIGKIWDGLRAAAASPVRFVVDTVWNNGILRAWNAIAGFLDGIDTKDPVPLGELDRYASGGVLPGYTPGRDPYTFIEPSTGLRIGLSGGEAIMRPEWTRAVGGPAAVERMNKAARSGRLDEGQVRIGQAHGFLGAFASGGVIGAMMDIVQAKYGNILTMTSGYRPGGPYHGTGQATDWSNGGGNTPEQLALAHDIAQTYPGSQELIYDSPGWAGNINAGRNVGPFGQFYTMGQAGPHHHHVHWAMTTPPTMQFGGGVFEGGNSGGGLGSAVVNWVADRARGVWDRMVSPIKGFIDDKLGDWGDSSFAQIPMGMFTSLRDTAWDFLTGMFGRGGGSNAGSVDVSDITGPVVDQVEQVFARHGFTGQQWEDAKWIVQQESSWNPTAVNPKSGAYGLFQFNPMGGNTLAEYLPDRNPDPAVQADAGARYMKDRYGDPTAARRFWEQNQWYDEGGEANGKGIMAKDTLLPERVLSPIQTEAFNHLVYDLLPRMTGISGESFSVMAKELSSAFAGEDWGYGELARYIGADLAESTIELVQAIGRADRGFRQWAAADEERGRMGTPQEWALHFGADAAATVGNDLLGLVGLGGIIGSTPNESLLDLLQVGAENLNDVYGWNLPVLSGEELKPMVVIDDEGRAIGTVIEIDDEDDDIVPSASDVAEPVVASTTTAADTTAADTATSAAGGKREVVLQIDGDAVSTETLNRAMEKISEELGDVTVRVEKLEGQMTASVVAGAAAGIV